MTEVYKYSIKNDFPNEKVDNGRLTNEINDSDIQTALSSVNTDGDECSIIFKGVLSNIDNTSLNIIVSVHTGESLPSQARPVRIESDAPHMSDGRPIIRADSRPMNFQTYYTMAGDDSTAGIGMGECMAWDFTTDEGLVTGDHVPSGMKCKEILATFLCPIHTKDGTIYFFDAMWGSFIDMDIVIPPNTYYPNPAGAIPAAALGLNDGKMYANTGADWVVWASYLKRHRFYSSCVMGDELNAEGSSVSAIPPGWGIRGRIYVPEADNVSKGYAELEMHRCHSAILPGQTVQDIIDAH